MNRPAAHFATHMKHAWEVRELNDPATSLPTLVFVGGTGARRVRTYPTSWRELLDDELYTLSWSR